MFDWIPIMDYTPLFYNLLLAVVALFFFNSLVLNVDSSRNIATGQRIMTVLFLFTLLYMGLRPVSGRAFVDMRNYATIFDFYAAGFPVIDPKDILFEYFIWGMAQWVPQGVFFFVCALLYLLPLYFACKKWFGEYWFYGLLMLMCTLTFWAYGVNGIRNGIASSVFLLALSRDKRWVQWALIIVSILTHKSMAIPAIGWLVVHFYANTTTYLRFWFLCIPVSFVLGRTIEDFFLGLGIMDETTVGYLAEGSELLDQEVKTGFRWDFLLYSGLGTFAGWYFIVKRKYEDQFYQWLFHAFLFANAVWILVIRANFSNRFAYLSWFMLGIVIIYPMLKMKFFHDQNRWIGRIVLAFYVLSYLINVLL